MKAIKPESPFRSRMDRRSWFALHYGALLFSWGIFVVWVSYQIPVEGWILENAGSQNEPVIVFEYPVLEDSTLQAGDQLLAINGSSIQQLDRSAYAFFRLQAPDWQAGTQLVYTVLRQGQEVSLEVTLVRPNILQIYQAMIPYVGLAFVVQIVASLTFFVVGLLVFWKKPSLPAAQALFVIGVCFLFNSIFVPNGATHFFYPIPPPSIPIDSWTAGINPSIGYLMLAFPTVKRPLRTHPAATLLALYLLPVLSLNLSYLISIDNPARYSALSTAVYFSQVMVTIALTAFNLIYSARKLKGPVEQAQFKWLAVGATGFVFVGIGAWLLGYLFGSWSIWLQLIGQLGWLLFPICLGIAITRYRLFDIDIIIRRTLVYGSLTILLGALYAGSVIILQRLFTAISGQQSPVALVISTLSIVALFNPLRMRVQNFVNRRFYRSRYNAELVLQQFSQSLRDEVDLKTLGEQLLSVTRDTVGPKNLSLWIQESER